ncbi:MAG: hypothetical protein A2Z75_07950 [Chloroflexi bacterium RBG_13_50_10]|nr:MAG: hypothetical protein A2Z75_07950 [Chloroflexi bacterium RBG_13_50_10]
MKGTMFLKRIGGRSIMALILVSVLLALGACIYAPASPTTAAAPGVSIVSPINGASLPAGDVNVTVSVSNFNVVDKQGQANIAGQGHIHYFLDVVAPTTAGVPAVPASGTWAHVSALTNTFSNVEPGTHSISVELVNNDHTPLTPPVVANITIGVTPAPVAVAPTLSITSPANGASLPAGNIPVTVAVNDFSVVDKQGQADVPGEGHIHYFLDVAAPTTAGVPAVPTSGTWAHVATTTYTFNNVGKGSHKIAVELVNNDHTPLVPPIVANISINVTSTGDGGGYGGSIQY